MFSKSGNLTKGQTKIKGKLRRIMILLGDAERAIGHRDYKSAREYCHKIIKSNPRYPFVYPVLGQICQKEGRLKEALVEYNKGIKIAPNQGWMYLHRGRFYQETGRTAQAFLDYNRALRLDKSDPLLFLYCVDFYKKFGRLKDVFAACNKVVRANEASLNDAGVIIFLAYEELAKLYRELIKSKFGHRANQ